MADNHYRTPSTIADDECRGYLAELDSRLKTAFHQGLVSTSATFYYPHAREKAISCAVNRMISMGNMVVTQKEFHNEEDSGIDVSMTYTGPLPK